MFGFFLIIKCCEQLVWGVWVDGWFLGDCMFLLMNVSVLMVLVVCLVELWVV